ncbi:MAG: hypothetical protein ACLP9L_36990 [Thermoguttaceae bacterium]
MQKSSKHTARFRCRVSDSYNHRKDTFQLGNGFAVIEAVRYDPQGQRLGAVNGFGAGLPVCQNARKLRHLGQPTAIFFLFDFNCQTHGQLSWNERSVRTATTFM